MRSPKKSKSQKALWLQKYIIDINDMKIFPQLSGLVPQGFLSSTVISALNAADHVLNFLSAILDLNLKQRNNHTYTSWYNEWFNYPYQKDDFFHFLILKKKSKGTRNTEKAMILWLVINMDVFIFGFFKCFIKMLSGKKLIV